MLGKFSPSSERLPKVPISPLEFPKRLTTDLVNSYGAFRICQVTVTIVPKIGAAKTLITFDKELIIKLEKNPFFEKYNEVCDCARIHKLEIRVEASQAVCL